MIKRRCSHRKYWRAKHYFTKILPCIFIDLSLIHILIQASTLVPVVVALAAYVTFLVKRSKKDLKEIIELEYSEKEQE